VRIKLIFSNHKIVCRVRAGVLSWQLLKKIFQVYFMIGKIFRKGFEEQ